MNKIENYPIWDVIFDYCETGDLLNFAQTNTVFEGKIGMYINQYRQNEEILLKFHNDFDDDNDKLIFEHSYDCVIKPSFFKYLPTIIIGHRFNRQNKPICDRQLTECAKFWQNENNHKFTKTAIFYKGAQWFHMNYSKRSFTDSEFMLLIPLFNHIETLFIYGYHCYSQFKIIAKHCYALKCLRVYDCDVHQFPSLLVQKFAQLENLILENLHKQILNRLRVQFLNFFEINKTIKTLQCSWNFFIFNKSVFLMLPNTCTKIYLTGNIDGFGKIQTDLKEFFVNLYKKKKFLYFYTETRNSSRSSISFYNELSEKIPSFFISK